MIAKVLSLKDKTNNYFNNSKVATINDLEKQITKRKFIIREF
jgi:hypothetical protein